MVSTNCYVGKRLAVILTGKRSAGVTPEVNLKERISCIPLPSTNKAAHSGFETQRRFHQKSRTGVSVAQQKGLMSSKIFFLNNAQIIFQRYPVCEILDQQP